MVNQGTITNHQGYNLMILSDNRWAIHIVGENVYHGSFHEVMMFCLKKLNFSIKELEEALNDMLMNDHDTAHFGMWKTYIYSFNSEWEKQSYA